MADLGNLFFRLGIKDEDAQKILDRLEKRLVQDGYKIKLRAPNASEFLKDLQQQLKQQTLDVKVRAIGAGTTGAATTPSDVRYARMMEVQQRMANAATAAQQRLINARNADARAAERHTAAMNRNNMTLLKANTSMSNQSRLLSGLRNQILDVYSIYTMERFLTSVIEIGGEFQKQHIALNAMLGDTAKADVMFGKIKELAVESPFNFRELMGFTKQIAAFGIPYEEMYETTKRLADISAGLGVDMGRIILAYGQVRSAAFLRGQELRQFTEAGIPLVDELAKKFTELEGRVVSAGEVIEKISKREVSFGMVKDVLWQLTNEGGKFYNMQEVLTESLSGKLAKLKDSWEIMLSTIAESNNGALGGTLDVLTKLTEKWEEAWKVIQTLIAAYGTYKASMLLMSAAKAVMIHQEIAHTSAVNANTLAQHQNHMAQTKVNKGAMAMLVNLQKLKVALAGVGKAGWLGLLLSAIAAVGSYLYISYVNAGKLHRELNEIGHKGVSSMQGEIDGFKLLVNKLGEATEGTKEYYDIKSQIQTRYGEYIGNINMEANAYENLKKKVDDVTEALRNKAAEDARQQMMSKVEESYTNDVSSVMDGILKGMKSEIRRVVTRSDGKKELAPLSDKMYNEVASIMRTRLQEAIKNGLDPAKMNYNSIKSEIESIVRELGATPSIANRKGTEVSPGVIYYSGGMSKTAEGVTKLAEAFKTYGENVTYTETQLSLLFGTTTTYGLKIKEIEERYARLAAEIPTDAISRKRQNELSKLNEMKQVYSDAGQKNEVNRIEAEIQTLMKLRDEWKEVSDEKFKAYAWLRVKDGEKSLDYINRLRKEYKDYKEVYKESLSEEEVKDAEKYMKAIESFFTHYKISLTGSKGGDDGSEKDLTLEGIKERLALIKTAYTEYKKWVELVGEDDAKNQVRNSGLFSVLRDEDIPTSLEDYKDKVKGIYIDLQEAIAKASTKERRDALREVLKQLLDTDYDIMKEVYLAEIESMREYLKEYGSFEQKKLAITQEYEDKIRKAQTEGKRLSLQKEKEKVLAQLSFQSITDGIDWKALFGGVNSLGKDMAGPLLDKLKAFTRTDEYAKADTQTKQDMSELIKELRKYVGTDDSVTWQSLELAIKNFTRAVDKYNEASSLEKAAIARREEAKVRFEKGEITEVEYNRLVEEANRFGKATAAARQNMDNLAHTVNSATDEIVNYTSKLTTVLNKASAWSDVDGFSNLKQSIGNIDKFVGAISSSLPSMEDGRGKEFSSKMVSAIQDGLQSVGTGLEKVLSSGIGQVIGFVAQIPKLIMNLASTIKGVITGILDSFSEFISLRWIDDMVVGIMNSLSGVVNSVFDLPENLFKTVESAWVDGIGGFANTFFGRVGNVLSFGLLSSKGPADWFKNSNAAEVAAIQERLEESNKILATSIDDLRDEISKRSGVSAINDAKRAKQYQEQYNKNLLDIAFAQAGYHGSHHSWNKYWGGFSQEQIARLSGQIGRDWDGNIWNLTPEEMKMLRSNADMWELILNTGKGGYGERLSEKLDAYIEQAGKLEEIDRNLAESLTQISFDGLRSEFIDSLMDMDKSAQDFANDFEKYMMKAVLNAKIGDLLDSELKSFYDEWAAYAESGGKLDENEIRILQRKWQNIIDKGLSIRDDAAQITGYEGEDSGSSNGLSKGIQGVTEETSSLIASYLNSVRADVSFKRTLQEKFFSTDFPQLSAIAQAQLTQLNAIAANTGRNVALVEDIFNILSRNIRGANKFNV